MLTNYKIIIEKNAAKFLESQPKKQQEHILKAIYGIPEGNIKPLQGYEDLYRLRIGSYRVIYRIDGGKLTVIILKIGNRGDVYKDL
jgi:mRNA interferase RelE/StbE